MPQIKFTDTNLKTLSSTAPVTWFSDPTVKGLQLCVTSGGTKTWYCNRWDPAAGKTRRVKLGQWNTKGTHCAWAKEQALKVMAAVHEGTVQTKAEKAVVDAGVPTLREAFEEDMRHRRSRTKSQGGAITEETEAGYRATFNRYFSTWADVKVDRVDVAAVQKHLDNLVLKLPFAAHKANVVLGLAFKRAERMTMRRFDAIPSLERNPKMQQREVDYSIPWADRLAEIEGIENEVIRLCWLLKWHTGMRSRMLRGLRWSDVDLDAGTVRVTTGLKKVAGDRVIALSSRSLDMMRRLHDIRADDAPWVFPSRRIVGEARGHLDTLDRLPLTSEADLRHLWNEATQDVDTREMVLRWLCGQALTSAETKNLGLYGQVPVERQRKVADMISSVIDARCGIVPKTVIEIQRNRA